MKKTLFLIALLFCSYLLFSQERYKPGLVVKNGGDTLKGWVKYGNWKINPSKIEFKADSNSRSAAQYTVDDIQYFEITGRDAYKKATVTRDMRSVNPVEISSETRDTTQTGTLFLRILVSGKKLILYEFVDFKSHYFLQAGNDTVDELLYKLYMYATDNIVSEWNNYKQQLRGYAGDKLSPFLDREIDDVRYSGATLAKVVIELNGKDNLAVYGETNGKSKNKPQFFVSAGATLSRLGVSGNDAVPEVGMNYKSADEPILSIGMDLSSSRNFNDFTFRLEVAFSQNTYKGDKHSSNDFLGLPEYETYTVKQQSISPSISAMYNFRRTKRVRYYAGLGLAYNISGYSMNRYTQVISDNPTNVNMQDNPMDLEKYWMAVFLRAGARLGRKFEIGATGDIFGGITNYSYFSASPRNYSLKLAYFLF